MRFKSGAAILEMFGLAKGGKEYRRIVAGFERIFGATIFFGSQSQVGLTRVVDRARFNFIQHARIWYDGVAGAENVVSLSPEFFAEIQAHPIPTDLRVARLLASSPGAFDLYVMSHSKLTSLPLFKNCNRTRQARGAPRLDRWKSALRQN